LRTLVKIIIFLILIFIVNIIFKIPLLEAIKRIFSLLIFLISIYGVYVFLLVEYREKKDEYIKFVEYQRQTETYEKIYEKKIGRLYNHLHILRYLKRIEIPLCSVDRKIWFWSINDENWISAIKGDFECEKKNISRFLLNFFVNLGKINIFLVDLKITKENMDDLNFSKIKVQFSSLMDSEEFEEKIVYEKKGYGDLGLEKIIFEITNNFDCEIRGFKKIYRIEKQFRNFEGIELSPESLDFNEKDIEIVAKDTRKISYKRF